MAQTVADPNPIAREHHGLTADDVQQRIRRGQSNNYESRVSRSYWDIFRDNVLNLFNIVIFTLLIIVLYYRDYGTFVFAGFSVISNTFFGMIQEMSAKRQLDNLAELASKKATVIRDGEQQEIPMKQVVKDDLLLLEPGTKAVVDGIVVDSDTLEMDESLLTGESDAVFKSDDDEILSGSFCVAGRGIYRATRVGKESNINQLSEVAKQYKVHRTPTQRRIDIVVELTVVIMFIFVPMLIISDLLVTQPPLTNLQIVRNAVVFVTTLVPQGLVLTAILSLTLGAIKISRQDTLVQKVNAVESLANATVLCFDKTGTLTKNELHVEALDVLSDDSQAHITQQLADYLDNLAHQNRTASAVQDYVSEQAQPNQRRKQREIPFTSGRKWGAVVFEGETLVMGAPERLLTQDHPAHDDAQNLSKQGKRVLVFGQLPTAPESDTIAEDVTPLALIIMGDAIRDDIEQTLNNLRAEDVKLKVISGDNLETVRAIAAQSGMDVSRAYTGDDLSAMSDSDLRSAVAQANVFARVDPDTKRRIVASLQAQGDYVAMVGDGVNDVPALKQADLAIVMNDGTQISKDVADLVLLNNAMSTLPKAFAEGTEITQTIYGTMKLFLIRGMYHILFFVYIMFMGLPFPFTPIQISWVTLGSINIPATLIALNIIRPQFMKDFRDDVMDYIIIGGIIGSVMLTITFVATYFYMGRDTESARSAVTFFVVLFNVYIVLLIQGVDFYKPQTFIKHWRIVAAMLAMTVVTIWLMYLAPNVFEFTPIGWQNAPLVFVLIAALMALALPLMAQSLHSRYLVHRFWALLVRDESKLES